MIRQSRRCLAARPDTCRQLSAATAAVRSLLLPKCQRTIVALDNIDWQVRRVQRHVEEKKTKIWKLGNESNIVSCVAEETRDRDRKVKTPKKALEIAERTLEFATKEEARQIQTNHAEDLT